MACPAGYTFYDRSPAPFSYISDNLRNGQRVIFLGHEITWTEQHLRPKQLEMYRMRGDPVADEALAALNIKHGQDAYAALMAYVQRPIEDQESNAPRKFLEEVMHIPDWVDWDRIARGQSVFWRYVMYISVGLVHFSLAGGFNAPKFTKVLTSTGYLAGNGTKARILETGQFVFDVMRSIDYLKPGSGEAWKSIIQVRFLHSQVRCKLSRLSKAHSKFYNIEEHGVPINQEDMAATIFSLSTAMWRFMETRLGVHMSMEDREDYLQVWRYVGYFMGVDPAWDPARDVSTSSAVMESILMHIVDPNDAGGKLAEDMLQSVSAIGDGTLSSSSSLWSQLLLLPRLERSLFQFNMAVAETLIGRDAWSLMGLKTAPWFYRQMCRWLFTMFYLDLWIVSRIRWWYRVRSYLVLKYGEWCIRSVLGTKRSSFVYVKEPTVKENDLVYLKTGGSALSPSSSSLFSSLTTRSFTEWQRRVVLSTLSVAFIMVAARKHKTVNFL
ncbi:hypothetical protein BGW42_001668 [Actinomortierella wolfii]|nr:hypothetical protein BGW42_001668 [Actinomortierella wolfii]